MRCYSSSDTLWRRFGGAMQTVTHPVTSEGGHFSMGNLRPTWQSSAACPPARRPTRRRPLFDGNLRPTWQSSTAWLPARRPATKAAIFRWQSSVDLAIFDGLVAGKANGREGGHFSMAIFGQLGNLRRLARRQCDRLRRRPFFDGNLRPTWASSTAWRRRGDRTRRWPLFNGNLRPTWQSWAMLAKFDAGLERQARSNRRFHSASRLGSRAARCQ